MLFIAALMTPWMNYMQALGVTARILADDIFLAGFGEQGHKVFQQALNATHQYLLDMGARIAPDKSYLFASHANVRQWLRQHVWSVIGTTIPTVLHVRDLGAHLNTTARDIGVTLTGRMQNAALLVAKVHRLPIDVATKITIILCKAKA